MMAMPVLNYLPMNLLKNVCIAASPNKNSALRLNHTPNMELEKQVSNQALSLKMRDLGVKQESLFWWVWEHVNFKESLPAEPKREWRLIQEGEELPKQDEEVSAFTVAELGEMLPLHKIEMKRFAPKSTIYCALLGEDGYTIFEEDAVSEADARAKMLIYLLENKLITPQSPL